MNGITEEEPAILVTMKKKNDSGILQQAYKKRMTLFSTAIQTATWSKLRPNA